MSELTEKKKVTFLEKLSEGASVTKAAKAAGISRGHAYSLRDSDAAFGLAWDQAIEEGTDCLEDIALKFASKGDSSLIKFLLGARRPEMYRERKDINLSGSLGIAGALDALEEPNDSSEPE